MPRIERPARNLRAARRIVRYQPTLQSLRALLFPTSSTQPTFISVPTLVNPQSSQRFPCVEAVLGTGSYTHDCIVFVHDHRGAEHQFLVSCQKDTVLPANRSLRLLISPADVWEGDLLVMKMGQRASFVRLSTQDKDLAIAAVTKFLNAASGGIVELPDYVE